jgi:hypothetical protein
MQGDTDQARLAYKDFLTLWKDADPDPDPDTPILWRKPRRTTRSFNRPLLLPNIPDLAFSGDC